MNDDVPRSLSEVLLRRELTPEEEMLLQAWLTSHPEARAEWLEDGALARALRRLHVAQPSSNFTVRVLAQVQRERPPQSWPARVWRWRPAWPWPQVGLAAAGVMLVASLAWREHSRRSEAEYARHLAALRTLAHLPPDVLQDFEVIRRLGESSAPVDFELLAALQ